MLNATAMTFAGSVGLTNKFRQSALATANAEDRSKALATPAFAQTAAGTATSYQ